MILTKDFLKVYFLVPHTDQKRLIYMEDTEFIQNIRDFLTDRDNFTKIFKSEKRDDK